MFSKGPTNLVLGSMAKLVTCLTADQGVTRSILGWFGTFVDIDSDTISRAILLLPLIQNGLLSVTSECLCMKYW